MRAERRSLLEAHQMQLAKDIDLDVVVPYLEAVDVIPKGVVESINSCTGLKARLVLLNAIKARGDSAYNAFYDALIYSKQENLAALLKPLATDTNRNMDGMVCHVCPLSPVNGVHMRSRSMSEHEERGSFYNSYSHGTFPRSNNYFHRTRDPTAWIDEHPMELSGVLDLPVEGTDGVSIKDQLEMWQRNSGNVYPNFTVPKGLCLIINNHKFSTMPQRNGTEVDLKNASQLFRQIGYKIVVHNDLTAKEMMSALCEFAQNKHHGDSLVVIVLTHGESQVFMGTDGETLNINYALSQFNSINAPHLTGKPKVFFFQACRGERFDRGAVAKDQTDARAGFTSPDAFSFSPFSCVVRQSSSSQDLFLPAEADFFVAYATTLDYVSWRNSLYGSWFIQALCEVFSKHAREMDISEMMMLVNRRISHGKSTAKMHKQTPEYSSRLRKKFYFFPGLSQP